MTMRRRLENSAGHYPRLGDFKVLGFLSSAGGGVRSAGGFDIDFPSALGEG